MFWRNIIYWGNFLTNVSSPYDTILGLVGVAFASSGLSQALIDELIPEGTTPIAAFLTNPTRQSPTINATSATFAETASVMGMFMIM